MLDKQQFNKRAGWFTEQEAEALYNLVIQSKARTVLEIGCWEGRSTFVLCEALGPTGTVFSVDHFMGVPGSGFNHPTGVYANLATDREGVIQRFLDNTFKYRVRGQHFLIEAPFDSVYPHLDYLFKHTPLDLAFIDDDHSYEAVKRRIQQCRMLVRPGGIICGHDYRTVGNAGVQQALEEALPGFKAFNGTSLWAWQQP